MTATIEATPHNVADAYALTDEVFLQHFPHMLAAVLAGQTTYTAPMSTATRAANTAQRLA